MTAKRRHADRSIKRGAKDSRATRQSTAGNGDRQSRHETVAAPLAHRRLVNRYQWTAAHGRLRDSKQPFEAHALHATHEVIVKTTARGAAGLGPLGRATSEAMPTPTQPARRPPPDALDIAFARAADEARQGRKAGARRA